MGLDQVHEQNNAVMKGIGGATPSSNKVDESSLARWGLCIHELASIISEYESDDTDEIFEIEALHHHEDTAAFQKRFTKGVDSLDKALMTNPFKQDKLTVLNNHEEDKFNDSVFEDVKIIHRHTRRIPIS